MFNHSGSTWSYNNFKVLGGTMPGDYNTHRTMFAGPDPADNSRVLIRKLVQTSEHVWCFEESRISKAQVEGGQPTVHTTVHRLGQFDIQEEVSDKELNFRHLYRSMPSVVGFSLFNRSWENAKRGSVTIVENSMAKANAVRWQEWLRDIQDRRDLKGYLRSRWALN